MLPLSQMQHLRCCFATPFVPLSNELSTWSWISKEVSLWIRDILLIFGWFYGSSSSMIDLKCSQMITSNGRARRTSEPRLFVNELLTRSVSLSSRAVVSRHELFWFGSFLFWHVPVEILHEHHPFINDDILDRWKTIKVDSLANKRRSSARDLTFRLKSGSSYFAPMNEASCRLIDTAW